MCANSLIYNKIKYITDTIPISENNNIIIEKFKTELDNLYYRHPKELNNMNSTAGERLIHLINKYFPETEDMPKWYKTIRNTIE